MKIELFVGILTAIAATGVLFELICRSGHVRDSLSGTNAVVPPFIAVIAVIFALFSAANASDIWTRSRALRLSTEQEASTARSIVKFTENVGKAADQLHRALFVYLDAAVTVEKKWLETGEGREQPAQDAADALVREATLFAMSDAAPALKSLIITRVDELEKARVERLTRFEEHEALQHWLALMVLAMFTQLSVSLVHVGKPVAGIVSQTLFTVSVLAALVYLAVADGTLGPPRTAEMMASIGAVRDSMTFAGVAAGK